MTYRTHSPEKKKLDTGFTVFPFSIQKGFISLSPAGYEKRLASINSAYARLRDGRADSGSRAMSPIPDASIRAADPASDNRLLEALRAADEQTARLIELQAWVSEQGKVTP